MFLALTSILFKDTRYLTVSIIPYLHAKYKIVLLIFIDFNTNNS